MRQLQIIKLWLRRKFFCWHAWQALKHHGLPNEPYLSRCCKCGYINKTIGVIDEKQLRTALEEAFLQGRDIGMKADEVLREEGRKEELAKSICVNSVYGVPVDVPSYELGVEEERERIVEWANEERTAGSMDEDGHPQDWCIDYDDLIAYLQPKGKFVCSLDCGIEQKHTHTNGHIKKVFFKN